MTDLFFYIGISGHQKRTCNEGPEAAHTDASDAQVMFRQSAMHFDTELSGIYPGASTTITPRASGLDSISGSSSHFERLPPPINPGPIGGCDWNVLYTTPRDETECQSQRDVLNISALNFDIYPRSDPDNVWSYLHTGFAPRY